MFRKNSFIALFAAALLLAGSLACFAQGGKPLTGKIVVKKADGSTAPVTDASLEFYRTDVKEGKLAPGKTDEKGAFTSDPIPSGQVFAILVTGPTISPQVAPGVKSGEAITITVDPGQGGVPTEEEVRELILAESSSPDSEEGKKAREARAKKAAAAEANNAKAINANKIIAVSLKEGNDALDAKNYDLAIDKYTQGYNADPEFLGAAPAFLLNRAVSLTNRATGNFNKSNADPASKSAAMESIKKDLAQSIDDFQKSYALLKTASDPKLQKDYDSIKRKALSGLVESHRMLIVTRADTTRGKEAVAAVEEYSSVETDAARKSKAQLDLAVALSGSGDSENAIPLYRKVLEASPDNVDAIGGLGLSLFAVGVLPTGTTEQKQEGLNLMEKFSQIAPDNHPMKASIKESADYLKTNEKLIPQKVTTTKSTTRKKS